MQKTFTSIYTAITTNYNQLGKQIMRITNQYKSNPKTESKILDKLTLKDNVRY